MRKEAIISKDRWIEIIIFLLPNTGNLIAKKKYKKKPERKCCYEPLAFKEWSYYKEGSKKPGKMDTFPKTVSFCYYYLSFKEKGN